MALLMLSVYSDNWDQETDSLVALFCCRRWGSGWKRWEGRLWSMATLQIYRL